MADYKERFKNATKQRAAGCPLFDGRDKGDLEDLEGKAVKIQRAYPLTGDNGRYYALWFAEEPDCFFLSNSALTGILDEGLRIAKEEGVDLDEVVSGLVIRIGALQKTKNGRRFRPVEMVEG